MNKKGKLGLFIIVIFILIVTCIEIFGIPYHTIDNGTHTGVITAIETTGIIFKTVTVYVKTDPMSSQEDKYCLVDRSLIPQLTQLEQSKEKVTVEFNDYLVKGWINCDSEDGGIIIGIK